MCKVLGIASIIFLVLTIFAQLPSQAQSKKTFVITGKIMPEAEGTGNGSIEISKNGKETKVIDIPKNGRFRFELEFFNEYNLIFKYPGHFNKIIQVSTEIPDAVWKRDNDFPPFPMIVQLTKEFEGVDKSFTLKPSGRIFYGEDIDNFEKESFINELQFLEQSAVAKTQNTQVEKEAESINKVNTQDLAAKQKEFDQLIKEADAYYQRGEYQMALIKYLEAKKLFPDRAYPNDRVAELQDLVKALEINEKQKADLEEKYKTAISKANGFFDQKSYKEARPVYEEALQYKSGDVFATGRINEIDQLLALFEKQNQFKKMIANADNEFKSKKYEQAIALYSQAKLLIPDDKYPQAQIDLINQQIQEQTKLAQLENEFNQTMLDANALAKKKDYLQALETYKKALGLKPDSQIAKDKVGEIEQTILTLENDKKYAQAIQLADQALAKKDWETAKNQYQEALKVKQEDYPKNKLAEIETNQTRETEFKNLLAKGEKDFGENKLDDALAALDNALKLKPDDKDVKKRIDDIQNIKTAEIAEKEYTRLIAEADQSFGNNSFEKAIASYNKALEIKKAEAYPKEQLQKISNFQSMLKKADKSYEDKDFSGALQAYIQLLTVKPNDSYSTSKIEEIRKIQDELKQKEEKEKADQLTYNNVIKEADQLFADKNFTSSIAKYKEALAIKPAETYPPKRIKEIETKLDEIEKEKARIENEYKSAIAQSDDFLEKKDYANAKSGYQKALTIKADQSYPKEQVNKIDQIQAEIKRQEAEALKQQQEKTEKSFAEAMTNGDNAFASNDLSKAQAFYQTALTLKPNEQQAKKKLGETEAKIAQIARNTIAYNKAVTEANSRLTASKYPEAKEKYEEALQYLPNEDYPKRQIEKINELLAQQAAEVKTRQDYESAVKQGESLLKSNDLANAKLAFTKAYNLIPSEPFPPQKIKEISELIAEQQRVEAAAKATLEAYQQAIKKADGFFASKDYPQAQMAYSEALVIKSEEKYPQDQLDLIKKLLSEQNDKNYKDAIAKADNAFASSQFTEASTNYREALKYRNDDQYATGKLKEIEKKKAEIEQENARLKKLNSDYLALVADADNDFKNKNYQKAKEKYEKALEFKPEEVHPKDQIVKIDAILAGIKQMEENNKQFALLLKQGEESLKAGKLPEARGLFQKANELKPEEPVPPIRIAEIDNQIARQKETARVAALEEAARNAKIKADKETYDKAIAAGDKDFNDKQYLLAKVHYNDALIALPNEKYPKDQIVKCNELLAQEAIDKMAAREKARMDSIREATNQLFDATMNMAQKLEQKEQFEQAIAKYNEAITIKPDRRAEIQKIIDGIRNKMQLIASRDADYARTIKLANSYFTDVKLNEALTEYENALKIKPEEEYPKSQIKEIRNQLAAREQKYAAALSKADNAYNQSDWVNARMGYLEALKVKPEEEYPAGRLKEVTQKIADANMAAISKAAEDKAYKEAIDLAEKAFKADQLSTAKLKYQEAQSIKPKEELPPQKIKEIDALIDQRNKERLAQQQRELDEKYRQTIVLADNSYKAKTYNIAKLQYQQASLIKPDEQYPKTQMELMDKLMNEAKPLETYAPQEHIVENTATVQKPVLNADESAQATEKRAESFETTTNYDDAIKKADLSFGIKDYAVARFYYYKASEIKATEEYPKNQIEQIKKLIDSNMSASDIAEYDKIIGQADAAFGNKNYPVAKFFYYKALGIKSWEKYPKDRINEINALTHSLLSEREENEYKEMIAKADEALVNKDIAIARFYYNKALRIKASEEYPKIKLKDIQKLVEQDVIDKQNELYKSYVDLGDQAMQAQNFSVARYNYNKALTVKPNEKYPKDQIKLIKEAIEKKNKETPQK